MTAIDNTLDRQLPLEVDAFLEEARKRTGLQDFGPTWFLEGMAVFLKALREEARLTPEGRNVRRETYVNGLVNRLQMFDWIKRHPDILKENVNVAGVVVGLPRTGSTMLHRLLDAGPNMTATRMWECDQLAPLPGEERGNPVERKARAEQALKLWLQQYPEMAALHPPQFDAAEEEVLILDQWFTSMMPESMQWVPSFGEWHLSQDHEPAYRDLYTALQFLQWQQPERRSRRWVLKTPSHSVDLPVVMKIFPDAKIINTHRDPLETIPSYASMMAMNYGLVADSIDPKQIGPYWSKRWGGILADFMKYRDGSDSDRFIDVMFRDVMKNKIPEVKIVFEKMGFPLEQDGVSQIQKFIENDIYETSGKHNYTMEQYGLTPDMIERDFAAYREKYFA